jgi:hypothetical protein
MAYKCRICGINDVENDGDICELCRVSQDPYAVSGKVVKKVTSSADTFDAGGNTSYPKSGSKRKVLINGGTSVANQDPYGNDMGFQEPQNTVKVYSPGQAPASKQSSSTAVSNTSPSAQSYTASSGSTPITSGITKNISFDDQKKSFISKWFRAMFTGIPFTFDDDITLFQVFPDYTGTSLTSAGNACDQVIIYGKLNKGSISENNDVEVYGHRDSHNNIIAKTIRNKASGTTVTPMRTINAFVVWLITAALVFMVASVVMKLGVEGLIIAGIVLLCLTNLSIVFKIIAVIFGAIFFILKHIF